MTDTDEVLLRRSAKGDESAFTSLYHRRKSSVYRFALHMSGRDDVAEEVTQDVFLLLIRDPQRFDASRGSVLSYLLGVARNLVLRVLERERGHLTMEDEHAPEPVATDVDLFSGLDRAQTIEAVRQAVLTLPSPYREAVALCDLEEMSYVEAASALGVPVGTVRSRLNRARGLLVEKLGKRKNAVRCSA